MANVVASITSSLVKIVLTAVFSVAVVEPAFFDNVLVKTGRDFDRVIAHHSVDLVGIVQQAIVDDAR